MIVAVLANHALAFVGVVYLVTTTWKIARRYPLHRWFF
jgi:hypothetical protein